jgi:hypothetical protein
MDKIFTQEELYWLDDILPGTKLGRIRRLSISRNVSLPKTSNDVNNLNRRVSNLFQQENFSLI